MSGVAGNAMGPGLQPAVVYIRPADAGAYTQGQYSAASPACTIQGFAKAVRTYIPDHIHGEISRSTERSINTLASPPRHGTGRSYYHPFTAVDYPGRTDADAMNSPSLRLPEFKPFPHESR